MCVTPLAEGIDCDRIEEQNISVLCCIEGSSQRHICSTTPDYGNPKAVICAVPEHEPAEDCSLSLVFFGRQNQTTETVPLGKFVYETDRTQLLAVYLAQSVHDVESLEDWDEIRGEGFSLIDEDFSTLDDRLSCAFHHLLLPEKWSLLGDHKEQVARETLYHFCVRLGLVKFLRLLFTKPGAKLSLQIPNRHNELPKCLAQSRQHDELFRILSDPNAVERYAQPLPETHDLDNGACLRYTDQRTINIDIDVSNEQSKRPLDEDILLFHADLETSNLHQRESVFIKFVFNGFFRTELKKLSTAIFLTLHSRKTLNQVQRQ